MNNPYTSRTYSRIAQLWRLIPMLIALVAVNLSASAQTFVIGAGAISTTSTGSDPINGYYNAMRYQVVYLASELSTGGMVAGDNLSGLGWSVSGDYAGGNLGNYTISIGHTAATNCAAHVADALTVVKNPFAYNPTVTAAGVFDMIPFDTQFMWNGTSNIVVDICTGTANPFTGPYGTVRADTYTTGSRYKQQDGGTSQCALNTVTANANRPQIQFSYVGGSGCSGPPTPGNTLSSVAIACSGVNFTLSLQNATTGTGVSYQWESADDAAFTLNQAYLGTASTQITNQTTPKYYRCNVTCSGFGTTPSTEVPVGLNSNACECGAYAAIYATYSGDEDITVVTVGSMTNNTTCNVAAPGAGSVASQYSNFTGSVVGPSADQGSSVAFSVGQGTLCGGTYGNIVQIYVDWNKDGIFNDTDERVFNQAVSVSGVNVQAGNFTVPIGASLGTTRMRLVVIESGTPATNYAQTGYGWGETEDYCFTVTASSACNGTPAPGNTLSTVATACSGVNFTLSLQNQTLGSGVTYQWQSADDAAFTLNLTALGTLNTQVTNQTSAKWYRCIVSCSGALPPDGTSTPIPVGLNASACACGTYAAIYASSAADEDITVVTVGSMTNNSACAELAPGAGSLPSQYSNYTGSVVGPSANQGASVAFSVGQGALCGGTYTNIVQIYVDWNQDGVFNATDERVFAQAAGVAGINVQTGGFTVPIGASLGTTRMRIVINETSDAVTNWAQTAYTWGETEDYCFTVTAASACNGQPTPGNTLSSIPNACSGANFTLSLQYPTMGSGVTYLWESADDVGFTVNVASLGASNTQVTNQTSAKWYRCTVTCPSFAVGVSTPIQVGLGSACQCTAYCAVTNAAGGGCINTVQINTLSSTTAACVPSPGYTLRSETTSLSRAVTYPITVTTFNDGIYGGAIVSVWFDWDNSGTFDASEWFQPNTTGYTGTINVTVPLATPLGQIRMRVRTRGMGNTNGADDGCGTGAGGSFGSGTTEDFCVTITPEPACLPPGGLTVTATSSTDATVTWTGTGSFILEYGMASNFTIPGTDNTSGPEMTSTVLTGVTSPYVISGLVHPNQYRVFMRNDCTAGANGYSANTAAVLFYPQPPYDQCESIVTIPTLAAGNVLVLNGNNFGATDIEGFGFPVSWEAFTLTSCVQTLNVDYCGSTPARTNAYINLFLGCPFSSAGFVAWTGVAGPACPNGSVNVPYANLPAGTYYIAVMAQPGAIGPYGINVTAGAACPPPACAATPSPSDGGVGCTAGTTLSWPAVAYADAYTVVLDGNTVSTNQPGTTYAAGALAGGLHTWSVTPSGSTGTASGCPTWSFTVSLLGCYCASVATYTADEEIFSVTVNGVTNGDITPYPGANTGCTTVAPGSGSVLNQYSNYFPLGAIFSVQKGISSTFTIQEDECDGPTYWSNGAAIWIDYDQNGTFDDVTEKVFVENATSTGPRNIVGNFLVPMNALTGTTAMRVTVAESLSGAALLACMTSAQGYYYGETEDYLITVQPPPVPASATATPLNTQCGSGLFTIDVNVANFGSGTPGDIVYTVNGGGAVNVPAALGSNTIPAVVQASRSVISSRSR
ncbi:MAG: fibronectin type III domain-containing protein [Flavobacteriales bacterium]|nr:fibronectin type III domain-containing protein [Flavobacteriales bacterium]